MDNTGKEPSQPPASEEPQENQMGCVWGWPDSVLTLHPCPLLASGPHPPPGLS